MKLTSHRLLSAYTGLVEILRVYWNAYGGLVALLTSPFFHISIVLTFITNNIWLIPNWWISATSILPNVLGFSLGGYAIWLGWGDEEFKKIIAGRKVTKNADGSLNISDEASPYMEVSATFAHFVLVQLIALIVALVAQGLYFTPQPFSWIAKIFTNEVLDIINPIGWGLGYWLFIYSLMTAFAATIAIFRITFWYDKRSTDLRVAQVTKQINKTEN